MQHIRLKSFSFTFSGVHLNLVKVSVLYELWHNTFHQVLFDMSENEDVISKPVIMKKIIDANDCKTMQIILQNFLPSPKLKSTSICYGELRRENGLVILVSIVLTTTFLKLLRRQCFTWTIIFVLFFPCVPSL